MKNTIYILGINIWGVLLLCGCEHKELCYDHDDHALKYQTLVHATYECDWHHTINDATDWQTQWPEEYGMEYDFLRPAPPAGLRVLVYNNDGAVETVNLASEGGTISMTEGERTLLFYNNDTEYILFDELESTASARATTRTRTRTTYMGNSYTAGTDENTVTPPDMLFGSYIESHLPKAAVEAQTLAVTMRPLVFTYLIRYEFDYGLKYVALTRGALAGMAESVYLNNGRTSRNEATLLYDCTVEEFGAQALVKSFGIPGYPHSEDPQTTRKYALNLEVMLTNGNRMSFDFDVTDQVAMQPHGGVIIVRNIEISDTDGLAGGSGFDVTVDDWGEYEDIALPF